MGRGGSSLASISMVICLLVPQPVPPLLLLLRLLSPSHEIPCPSCASSKETIRSSSARSSQSRAKERSLRHALKFLLFWRGYVSRHAARAPGPFPALPACIGAPQRSASSHSLHAQHDARMRACGTHPRDLIIFSRARRPPPLSAVVVRVRAVNDCA